MVKGVASLLDKPITARVMKTWDELENRCGLTGVKITPFPHFSWQVTEDYDLLALDTILKKVARNTAPFVIHTAGLGLFTGASPVIYVAIIKDEHLLNFHKTLWNQINAVSVHPEPYYAPDQWVPHITLAYGDVRPDNLDCITQSLVFQSFEWTIRIDNLVTISLTDHHADQVARYRLEK
jgi:2'-5' RNA ligase